MDVGADAREEHIHAGFIAARNFLLVAFLLVVDVAPLRAQISPGPLSRAHQSLDGPTQCAACHKFGAERGAVKCLDCHQEIAVRLSQLRGFHNTVVDKAKAGRDCARCHSEHNGRDFPLINWQPSQAAFDHTKTGYTLAGKHVGVACSHCHQPQRIGEADRALIRMKDLRQTFLGLPKDCVACHRDAHKGQLGPACANCHTFEDWKAAKSFDHGKTRFPLTGKHESVACVKCHAGAPGMPAQFKGLKFETCAACHNDPHRGSFKPSCATCHATVGWKLIAPAGRFDHAQTKFPLLGKHASVQCTSCHAGADFKRPLPFERCSDCHKPDPHSGQFKKRPDGGECSACHSVEGFKVARFGVAEHAASQFPLLERHAAVACGKCHIPRGAATLYKITFGACVDCHTDVHKAQFAGPPHENQCERCHNVKGFRPSTFTIARHNQSKFVLTGAHMAVACSDCHKLDTRLKPASPVPYHFSDTTCAACHADPHRGQFRERMAQAKAAGRAAGCEACHSTETWQKVLGFDHATTAFPLLGAHRAVPCSSCHKIPAGETNTRNVDYRGISKECSSCHADVHAGQFSKAGRVPACSNCHTSFRWKPSTFDHNKTKFSLQGAHERVRCSECHKLVREVDGKRVVFYQPAPVECAACHGPVVPRPPGR